MSKDVIAPQNLLLLSFMNGHHMVVLETLCFLFKDNCLFYVGDHETLYDTFDPLENPSFLLG